MSSRKSVYVIKRLAAEPGTSPNAYVPQATAEIRVFYPPRDREAGARALSQAVSEAWAKFEEQAPENQLREPGPAAGDKLLVSVAEAAAMLNVGKNRVYELVYGERLPHVRMGRTIRIPTAAVEQFVAGIEGGGE